MRVFLKLDFHDVILDFELMLRCFDVLKVGLKLGESLLKFIELINVDNGEYFLIIDVSDLLIGID